MNFLLLTFNQADTINSCMILLIFFCLFNLGLTRKGLAGSMYIQGETVGVGMQRQPVGRQKVWLQKSTRKRRDGVKQWGKTHNMGDYRVSILCWKLQVSGEIEQFLFLVVLPSCWRSVCFPFYQKKNTQIGSSFTTFLRRKGVA
jgi:hypothetical protein